MNKTIPIILLYLFVSIQLNAQKDVDQTKLIEELQIKKIEKSVKYTVESPLASYTKFWIAEYNDKGKIVKQTNLPGQNIAKTEIYKYKNDTLRVSKETIRNRDEKVLTTEQIYYDDSHRIIEENKYIGTDSLFETTTYKYTESSNQIDSSIRYDLQTGTKIKCIYTYKDELLASQNFSKTGQVIYDESGNPSIVKDTIFRHIKEFFFKYDDKGNIIEKFEESLTRYFYNNYEYNTNNQLIKSSYRSEMKNHEATFGGHRLFYYDKKGLLTKEVRFVDGKKINTNVYEVY